MKTLWLALLLCLLPNAAVHAVSAHDADSTLKSILSIKDRKERMDALYKACKGKFSDAPKLEILFAKAYETENLHAPTDSNTAKANYLLAEVALLNGEYDKCLAYCLKALPVAERLKMYTLQIDILSDVSGVYQRTDDVPQSLKKIEEALVIARTQNFKLQEAQLLNGLSIRYAMLSKYSEAIKIEDSALILARQLNRLNLCASILENKAICYRLLKQFDTSIATFKQALVLYDTLKLKNQKSALLFQIGNMYFDMSDLAKSESYANQSLAISDEVEDPTFIISLYSLLYRISEEKGDYHTALEYLKKQVTIQDSIFNNEKTQQLQELQTKYDTDLKDKQIVSQRNQLMYNKKITLFLFIGSGLLIIIVLLVVRNQLRAQKLYRQIAKQSAEITTKSNELEHLNQVKDRLFSAIGHDMRTPVNSLLSFTTLLDNGNIPPDKLMAYASELKNNLGYTATLMENLLNFARSQMQGYNAQLEPIDFAAIVSDALTLLQPAAGQKNIQIINEVKAGTMVLADMNMMALVIRNLIGNAIKFTHKNGLITLSTSEDDNNNICLMVQDTGVGIDAAYVKAFNESAPTHQPIDSEPGTNNEKGTGLGLMLCKNFLALMGGQLHLESEPGRGSDFIICQPKAA